MTDKTDQSEEGTMDLKKVFVDSKDFQNIQEVSIPEEMNTKIKCGIDFVDGMFGDGEQLGFTPGTVTIFTGAPGGGKSTLSLQMANGFASQDIVTAYSSSEEHVSQIKKVVDRLGLEHPFYVSNSNNVDNVLRQAKDNDVKVLFIDSLQMMGTGKYDPGTTKATKVAAQKIIAFCKERFVVGIVIGHVTKQNVLAGPLAVKHAMDAHLHLDVCTNLNCLTCEPGVRTLALKKNRFGLSNQPQQLFLFPQGFKKI